MNARLSIENAFKQYRTCSSYEAGGIAETFTPNNNLITEFSVVFRRNKSLEFKFTTAIKGEAQSSVSCSLEAVGANCILRYTGLKKPNQSGELKTTLREAIAEIQGVSNGTANFIGYLLGIRNRLFFEKAAQIDPSSFAFDRPFDAIEYDREDPSAILISDSATQDYVRVWLNPSNNTIHEVHSLQTAKPDDLFFKTSPQATIPQLQGDNFRPAIIPELARTYFRLSRLLLLHSSIGLLPEQAT